MAYFSGQSNDQPSNNMVHNPRDVASTKDSSTLCFRKKFTSMTHDNNVKWNQFYLLTAKVQIKKHVTVPTA